MTAPPGIGTPPGFGTIVPYIFVDGADAYLAFLTSAFGAVEIGRSADDAGRIGNAQVAIGDSVVMVSEASAAYPPTRGSYYLYVADADAAMTRAIGDGAVEIMGVADMPYGDRQGGVTDPAGNIWWVSQRLVAGGYF